MYISVDMGGTNTRIAGSKSLETIELSGGPIRRENTGDYTQDLDFIIDSAKRLTESAAITAVGIGAPGSPNADRKRIATAINLPQWNNQPFIETISDELNCPVYFDNDAVTAGLGEAYYGGHPPSDFHYLIWGTGIGGSEVRFDETGDVTYAAKLHWKKYFKQWTVECGGKSLEERYGDQKPWSEIMQTFSGHLLRYVEQYQPPAIVFGGGLAEKHRHEIESLGSEAGIKINVSRFGGSSGMNGGFGLIRFCQDRELPPVDETDIED